jgi:hypothetical protein
MGYFFLSGSAKDFAGRLFRFSPDNFAISIPLVVPELVISQQIGRTPIELPSATRRGCATRVLPFEL